MKYGDNCLAVMNCASKKLSYTAPAKELYTGTVFKVIQKYCETNFRYYCIISAKHGMLLPTDIIDPYELYIADLDTCQQQTLFKECAKKIKKTFPQCDQLYFYTTSQYSLLADYVDGTVYFPISHLHGRQKLHYLLTGDSSVVDIDDVLRQVVQSLGTGGGWKKSDICKEIKNILPEYSSTYINRIVTCSTVNGIGEKGIKQRNIFEINDGRYYLYGKPTSHKRRLF